MGDSGNHPRTSPVFAVDELTFARTAPDAIASQRFTIVKKGFHPGEVMGYLEQLAGDVEILHYRLHQLQPSTTPTQPTPDWEAPIQRVAPASEPTQGIDEDLFMQAGSRIAGLMRTLELDVRAVEQRARAQTQADIAAARAESDEIRIGARLAHEEAVADAAAMVASARNDADVMLREAKTRADELEAHAKRILIEARSRAEDIVREISGDRTNALHDVRRLRDGLEAALARIDGVLEEHEEDPEDADRLIIVDEPTEDRSGQ
jgi:cell division septum initiation protein DivIVA